MLQKLNSFADISKFYITMGYFFMIHIPVILEFFYNGLVANTDPFSNFFLDVSKSQ